MKTNATICLFLILSFITNAYSIGVSTGICYAGCASLAVACYSAAGFVFGTVTAGAGVPAAVVGCNAAFGACMAKCSVATAFLP
jgi:hypothetical protein